MAIALLPVAWSAGALAQGVPVLTAPVSTTLTPQYGQLAIPDPAAPPPSGPATIATGTWTWGQGSASASATVGAVNPKAGRIYDIVVGGATTYRSLNAVVTSPPNPVGNLARITDTLTASGAGLTATGTGGVYFFCLWTPCGGGRTFTNYNNSDNRTGTALVRSAPLTWTGDATAFVQQNAAAYGAQTVSLQMTTSIQNLEGTVSGYSVTGPYEATLGRTLIPWTTDDVIRGTILPGAEVGDRIGDRRYIGFLTAPEPLLGFTAQEAAALSGFTNFNYIQTYTGTGQMTWEPQRGQPTNVSYVTTIGQPLNDFPVGDPRRVGMYDPEIGGNPGRPADMVPLYYDQTGVAPPPPGGSVGFKVFDDQVNFGLTFTDSPNFSWNDGTPHGVGSFVTFQTQLVGVSMYDNGNGTMNVDYHPMTSSVDGSLDMTTIFNWMWVQRISSPRCDSYDCGDAYLSTAGTIGDDEQSGIAVFLGFGAMTPDQLTAALNRSLGRISDYWYDFGDAPTQPPGGGSTVPEPATWTMLLTGFFGMGVLLRRRRRQAEPLSARR